MQILEFSSWTNSFVWLTQVSTPYFTGLLQDMVHRPRDLPRWWTRMCLLESKGQSCLGSPYCLKQKAKVAWPLYVCDTFTMTLDKVGGTKVSSQISPQGGVWAEVPWICHSEVCPINLQGTLERLVFLFKHNWELWTLSES